VTNSYCRAGVCLAALTIFFTNSASALSIREFRKYTLEKQAVYVAGAVSMTAYTYASNGDTTRARCIQQWFFRPGPETPGPRELAVEIGVAEQRDADKHHVEGIILGLTDRVCGGEIPLSKP